ncbi:MAG: cytochrome c biogenesis protein CcdA [bacterium]
MKTKALVLALLMMAPAAGAASPFAVQSAGVSSDGDRHVLAISFDVPERHHLFADEITVRIADGPSLEATNGPAASVIPDPDSGKSVNVYGSDVTLSYPLPPLAGESVKVRVRFRGCSDTTCFLPQTTNIVVSVPGGVAGGGTAVAAAGVAVQDPADWKTTAGAFHLVARGTGYMSPDEFVGFLDRAERHETTLEDRLAEMFRRQGVWTWFAVLLIVIGGLGLNLTPCVLPMIPINIAIIGAGAADGGRSRLRGFALGAVYGGAMALVYGALGLAAVLTGTRFGALNSSYVFNAVIAVVFVLLALAMFNVIHLDFSRFQGAVGAGKLRGGSIVTAFVMGGVAALLAGSCVAPVVISVLLIAVDLCARDACIGLILPFVLGLGMGLPWPFLGAGLGLLPRPGRWMVLVKYGFGIFILGMAAYYGHTAYGIYSGHSRESRSETAAAQAESGWIQSLQAGLEAGKREGKPVLIDFWATWCKSCVAMNQTTFKNERVRKRLAGYVAVKRQAEDLDDAATREMLDHFKIVGLPTYVVLIPAGNWESGVER